MRGLLGAGLIAGAAAAAAVSAVRSEEPAAAGIEQVAWLQGCWARSTGTRTTEEQWMAPRDGCMLGMSRTVQDGALREWEAVVLREQDGRLAYEAHPSGQAATVFLSRSVDESSVIFENPDHDFPQVVGYRLLGDSLAAWIEGTVDGRNRRVDFGYRRVPCTG